MYKIKKKIGQIFYNYFAKLLPRSARFGGRFGKLARYTFVRMFVKHIGKNVNIERGAEFSSELSIGNNSGIGINARINGKVTIGDNVMMGPECFIYTSNHRFDRTDIPISEQGYSTPRPVTIGNDVWIGSRVTILPGVNIGNGVVVGTGAVVTKSVDDFSIIGGSPARVIGKRK